MNKTRTSKKGEIHWSPFPNKGQGDGVIKAFYEKKMLEFQKRGYPSADGITPILSFPGTIPHEMALWGTQFWMQQNFNHIGDLTAGEGEFDTTEDCEREVISWMADMCGAEPNTVGGHITNGGTSSNITGLLMGRQFLDPDATKEERLPQIAVIGSDETHYTGPKGCHILGIGDEARSSGYGFHQVSVDETGAMTCRVVEQKIGNLISIGVKRFILFLTAGTCISGAIDEIGAIAREGGLVDDLNKDFGGDIKIFIHVDAAFGGFVLPFLEEPIPFGFQFKNVNTIGLDPHKCARMPYNCGAFLYRKGLHEMVKRKVDYLPSGLDMTLAGSRSGAIPMGLWALIKHLGRKGFEEMIRPCRDLAVYTQDLLAEIPGIYPIRSRINFASFGANWDLENLNGLPQCLRNFTLRGDKIKEGSNDTNRRRWIVKLPVMQHWTDKHVDDFVEALTQYQLQRV